MAKTNCTALIQYCPPTPCLPPRPRNASVTFYSLSREIRDEIYVLALVSASPIIVWKGELETFWLPRLPEGPQPYPSSCVRWREIDHEATTASLRMLNLNLLFCHKSLSHEAAEIFYSKNTFSFEGNHNWDPVASWLRTIGFKNRSSLQSLELTGDCPDQVWQNSRGERFRHVVTCTQEDMYPRLPCLQLPEGPVKWGLVDNINPVLEDVFLLLGQRSSHRKLTVVMHCPMWYPGHGTVPEPSGEDQLPELRWYSMEMANLIEHFLSLYTQRSSLEEEDSVEVLWKGRSAREEFMAEQDAVKNQGWRVTVLPAEYDDISFFLDADPVPVVPGGVAKYILRRKRLTGPLMAQDPSPFSGSFGIEGIDTERLC